MSSDSSGAMVTRELRFGQYLSRGVQAYLAQPRALFVQMLIAAGISLLAAMACLLPYWLVAGPLSAGLHYSGLLAVRGQPVTPESLRRGWRVAGTSMIAFFALTLMQVVPAILFYILFSAGFVAMTMAGAGPGFPGAGPRQEQMVQFFLTMGGMYCLMFLGMFCMMLWLNWFGARTMYVMPLIADRNASFLEALEESWRLTKSREWELTLMYFLMSMTAGFGFYLCYVGMLFTLPVYFTIIAAAYEEHALPQFAPPADPPEAAS